MLSSKNQWREKTIFFFLKTRLKKPFSLKGYPNAAQKPTRINITYIDSKKDYNLLSFYTHLTITKKIPRIFWFAYKQNLVLPKKLGLPNWIFQTGELQCTFLSISATSIHIKVCKFCKKYNACLAPLLLGIVIWFRTSQ